jgi:site-specific DNA recombinase
MLDHMILTVSDIKRSLAFYEATLKPLQISRRVSRLNPRSEWITKEVPHLRIISDELWDNTKRRQGATRRVLASATSIVRARRPRYLFSGLTKCGVCGSGFFLKSRHRLSCFAASDKGDV